MAEISINLRADPSQYEAGTEAAKRATTEWQEAAESGADDVAAKLEQVIRALVKLGTESGKTKDDMVRDLGNFGLSADQAERAIEAVWEEMGEGQRAAREVEKASDALKDVESRADDAASATKRVGDETEDTGGKFSELGDIARDVLEGDFGSAAESALGALGAIGAFAGAGGALAGLIGEGVGQIVGDWVGQWERAAEETRERMSTMYADLLQSGKDYLSDEFVQTRIAEIYDPENVEDFNKAVELSNQLGVERSTIIQAMAGDEEAHASVLETARDRLRDLNSDQEAYIEAHGRESAAIAAKIGETELGIASYDRYAGAQDTAAARAREARDAINEAGSAASDSSGKVDGLSDSIRKVPNANPSIFLKVDDSGLRDIESRVRALDGRSVAIRVEGQTGAGRFIL